MSLTPERIIYVRASIIVIGEINGSDSVYRITVDGAFRGYIALIDGDYQMMSGCVLSIYKFNTIVEAMKMGIDNWNKRSALAVG